MFLIDADTVPQKKKKVNEKDMHSDSLRFLINNAIPRIVDASVEILN